MLLKVPRVYHTIVRNASKYHTRDVVLKPYIDFGTIIHNKQKLEQNIHQRKLKIDVDAVCSTYLALATKRSVLECLQQKIEVIAANVRLAKGNETAIKTLKSDEIQARNDFKALKKDIKVSEKAFIKNFLDLPNDIHERTPLAANEVHFSHNSQRNITDAENHMDKVNYLEYHDSFCYFLKSDASKCDLQLPFYCKKMFRSFGFVPFSNPDFVRTILAEGTGVGLNELLAIVEDDLENELNRLHLAGGGSMLSFLGFLAKLLVYQTRLPLKFVSSGKNFSIAGTVSTDHGLYSTSQTTNVQLFGITVDESDSLRQFDETLEQVIGFYQRLDRTFRVRYVTADKLAQAEQFRADFEVFSPHRKCFVPLGHLSSYGDFISKRLLIAYKENSTSKFKFSHIISGNVINVTRLIAILLEEKGALSAPAILSNLK